jgi:hypothetical protein
MGELAEKAIRLMALDEKKYNHEDTEKEQTATPLPSLHAGDPAEHQAGYRDLEVLDRTSFLQCSDRQPGNCETCRAAGYWEGHGLDLWCFYEAVFLGRSAPAILTKDRHERCPLKNYDSLPWEPKA